MIKYPVHKYPKSNVWMCDEDPLISASRSIAVDVMIALGHDPDDFRLRDHTIMAICDKVNGMLNYVEKENK